MNENKGITVLGLVIISLITIIFLSITIIILKNKSSQSYLDNKVSLENVYLSEENITITNSESTDNDEKEKEILSEENATVNSEQEKKIHIAKEMAGIELQKVIQEYFNNVYANTNKVDNYSLKEYIEINWCSSDSSLYTVKNGIATINIEDNRTIIGTVDENGNLVWNSNY